MEAATARRRIYDSTTPGPLIVHDLREFWQRYGESVEDVLAPVDWERYDARVLRPQSVWTPEVLRPGMEIAGADPLAGAWIVARAAHGPGRR